jgi:hypothetical protein
LPPAPNHPNQPPTTNRLTAQGAQSRRRQAGQRGDGRGCGDVRHAEAGGWRRARGWGLCLCCWGLLGVLTLGCSRADWRRPVEPEDAVQHTLNTRTHPPHPPQHQPAGPARRGRRHRAPQGRRRLQGLRPRRRHRQGVAAARPAGGAGSPRHVAATGPGGCGARVVGSGCGGGQASAAESHHLLLSLSPHTTPQVPPPDHPTTPTLHPGYPSCWTASRTRRAAWATPTPGWCRRCAASRAAAASTRRRGPPPRLPPLTGGAGRRSATCGRSSGRWRGWRGGRRRQQKHRWQQRQ